jgi:hypothetical protein
VDELLLGNCEPLEEELSEEELLLPTCELLELAPPAEEEDDPVVALLLESSELLEEEPSDEEELLLPGGKLLEEDDPNHELLEDIRYFLRSNRRGHQNGGMIPTFQSSVNSAARQFSIRQHCEPTLCSGKHCQFGEKLFPVGSRRIE